MEWGRNAKGFNVNCTWNICFDVHKRHPKSLSFAALHYHSHSCCHNSICDQVGISMQMQFKTLNYDYVMFFESWFFRPNPPIHLCTNRIGRIVWKAETFEDPSPNYWYLYCILILNKWKMPWKFVLLSSTERNGKMCDVSGEDTMRRKFNIFTFDFGAKPTHLKYSFWMFAREVQQNNIMLCFESKFTLIEPFLFLSVSWCCCCCR